MFSGRNAILHAAAHKGHSSTISNPTLSAWFVLARGAYRTALLFDSRPMASLTAIGQLCCLIDGQQPRALVVDVAASATLLATHVKKCIEGGEAR